MNARILRDPRPLTESDLRSMRVPQRFWGSKISEVVDPLVSRITRRYLSQLHVMLKNGIGLLFWGDNGYGKTATACLIAFYARRFGYTVLFVSAPELVSATAYHLSKDRGRSLMDRALDADLLVIDDLGKEHHAESGFSAGEATDMLETFFRSRCAAKKTTLVTTNMSPRALKDETSRYKRSMGEVMKEALFPVKFTGPDLREVKKVKIGEYLMSTEPETED